MLKLMGKKVLKILQFYAQIFCLSKPVILFSLLVLGAYCKETFLLNAKNICFELENTEYNHISCNILFND